MVKKYMSFGRYVILQLAVLLVVTAACSTVDTEVSHELHLDGRWQQAGLDERWISSINPRTSPMLVATDSGLFAGQGGQMSGFGLHDEEVVDVVDLGGTLIAATLADACGDTTLFRQLPGAESWEPYLNNYGDTGADCIYSDIVRLASPPGDNQLLYTTAGVNVARSTNGGTSWEEVYKTWSTIGLLTSIVFDPQDSEKVWAGGSNAIGSPALVRSSDGGDSWERLTVLENAEAHIYDIALHPFFSGRVMVGMGGSVRKSTDNGGSWKQVFERAGIFSFTPSARNPAIFYGAGINREGTLFFVATGDFGSTWETVTFTDGPTDRYVLDIVSVVEDGKEVLYLGTNRGLYSYTFEE